MTTNMCVWQAQSWGDLLEGAIPAALAKAMDAHVDFRRGLPVRAFEMLGICIHIYVCTYICI